MPKREVEDFEIMHVDRRFFNGENAIRMLERILGIDASLYTYYKISNHFSAYQNNRGVYN